MKESQASELIEKNTKGYKVGKYLDITLYKNIDGTNESIHELTKGMKLTIKIPEELINKDKNVQREYFVARSHNGKVDILEAKYDEKTNSITFETDKFSDYAILYKDTKVEGLINIDSSDKQETIEKKKETKKVQTGDNTNGMMFISLFGISLLGIYYLITKKYIH